MKKQEWTDFELLLRKRRQSHQPGRDGGGGDAAGPLYALPVQHKGPSKRLLCSDYIQPLPSFTRVVCTSTGVKLCELAYLESRFLTSCLYCKPFQVDLGTSKKEKERWANQYRGEEERKNLLEWRQKRVIG